MFQHAPLSPRLHPVSIAVQSPSRAVPVSSETTSHAFKPAAPRVLRQAAISAVQPVVNSAQRMPSPRSSPAMRPTSPLSPRFEAARFDTLQLPSPRSTHTRQGNGSRRANTNSLKLPSLPRFHPANYPSSNSSLQGTPDGMTPPGQPMSPHAHSRLYSDAQKQLLMHHREAIAAAARGSSDGTGAEPTSPRLIPLGSPGPVTPLELEGQEYLTAGMKHMVDSTAAHEELMDKLMREESARRSRKSSNNADDGTRYNGR